MDTANGQSAIEKTIVSFQDAFNATDLATLVQAFTPDGVLMPNNAPSAKGSQPIKAVYEALFSAFAITLTYAVEDMLINGDYAIVRTSSRMRTQVHATFTNYIKENQRYERRTGRSQWQTPQDHCPLISLCDSPLVVLMM